MSRPPLWRLPPWTRAPMLGLRQPAAVVAVLVTTAILACAVASAPLFLSSARSAALQEQLAPQCAEAAWPEVSSYVNTLSPDGTATAEGVDGFVQGFREVWPRVGRTSEPVLQVVTSRGAGGNPQAGIGARGIDGALLSQSANVLWRPDITDHVEEQAAVPGSGIWLPASYAQAAGAAPGSTITLAGLQVPVVGVYTDLFDTDPGPYWCDYTAYYLNAASANVPPPALVLATDERTIEDIAAAANGIGVIEQVPEDGSTLTSTRAGELLAQQQAAANTVPDPTGPVGTNTRLSDALDRARLLESGLRGPVIPVAVAGGLLALVLVAAAGSFWADRRVTEVRLLAARGVGPIPLAGKAALELGLPALVGAALGWGASRVLIAGIGPAPELDPGATTAAVWAGVAAFVVGLGSAAVVAGLRARSTAERPLGAAPRWPATVPWELILLLAAAWCWQLLEGRDAVVTKGNVAQVNGLLVAFPLLALAGASVLLARLLTALLPRLRGWAGRRRPAVFLAVNRLVAARLSTATLLVAVALPVAALDYTATLTASAQTTLDAKVGVQLGAGAYAQTSSRVRPETDVGTTVERYDGSLPSSVGAGNSQGRQNAQVLAVDPGDFAGTAFWNPSFADEPLADLVSRLDGAAVDGRLPVVATGVPLGPVDLRLGRQEIPAQVVGQARVLPGRRTADPVVLAAADRLPDIPATAGSNARTELWTDGPVADAAQALRDAGAVAVRTTTPAQVQRVANFLGVTWTFGYLSALAVFVGVIALGGLLLYLEARSRTRVSGYVMARRLGLSRRAHLASLVAELGGVAVVGVVLGGVLAVGAVALVYRRLDVDLLRPPTPLLDVPWPAVAATVVVTLAVAGLAALYAQRAADRADPASVLREDA